MISKIQDHRTDDRIQKIGLRWPNVERSFLILWSCSWIFEIIVYFFFTLVTILKNVRLIYHSIRHHGRRHHHPHHHNHRLYHHNPRHHHSMNRFRSPEGKQCQKSWVFASYPMSYRSLYRNKHTLYRKAGELRYNPRETVGHTGTGRPF